MRKISVFCMQMLWVLLYNDFTIHSLNEFLPTFYKLHIIVASFFLLILVNTPLV